jgi:hypothetical protein
MATVAIGGQPHTVSHYIHAIAKLCEITKVHILWCLHSAYGIQTNAPVEMGRSSHPPVNQRAPAPQQGFLAKSAGKPLEINTGTR